MILEAARVAFAERGYHGTTTAEIAAAAACSEAVLYRHFPSKKALLLEVYDEIPWTGLIDAPDGGEGDLGGLVAVVRRAGADPEMARVLRTLVLALAMSDDPEVRERLLANFGAIRQRVAESIRAGQAAGRVRADLDPEAVVWLWQGLVLSAGIRNSVSADGVAGGAAAAAELLATLLRPPDGDGRTTRD
jgi:AcrR family transcriptional regulator